MNGWEKQEVFRRNWTGKLFPHMFAKTKYFEALNSKDSNLSSKQH